MPGPETRREFDKYFKADAVRAVEEVDKSVAQVARELGVNASTLRGWVRKDVHRRSRRRVGKALTAVVSTTIILTLLVSALVSPSTGVVVALAGLVATWVVCVGCWRVNRRPPLGRLVVGPVVQAWGAFFMGAVAYQSVWSIVLALIAAFAFACASILWAGFFRNIDLSGGAYGAGGGGGSCGAGGGGGSC